MARIRMVPGERLVARIGARRGGSEPGSLLARLEARRRSPLLSWASVLLGEAQPRPFSGLLPPPLSHALPEEEPGQVPASSPPRAARRRPSSAPPRADQARMRAEQARIGVVRRALQRSHPALEPSPLRSTWARRQLEPSAAAPRQVEPGAALTGAASVRPPHAPAPRQRVASPVLAAPEPPRDLPEPRPEVSTPVAPSALERLERREHQPVGVVARELASPTEPSHHAARGLEAARRAPAAVPVVEPPSEPAAAGSPGPAPLPHPARSVLHALARAGTPQEAARVVVERAPELEAARDLPAPLAEVVKQIQRQTLATAAKAAAATGRVVRPGPSKARGEPELPRALTRLTRGQSGSASGDVVSLSTMRLIRRLQQLVHIAEVDRRILEAQRRVRMAEDSAHARAEAASAPGADSSGEQQPVDLDTLGREVLAAVNDKLDSRNDRRPEDPDVPIDVF
jgi:hypothetical protein